MNKFRHIVGAKAMAVYLSIYFLTHLSSFSLPVESTLITIIMHTLMGKNAIQQDDPRLDFLQANILKGHGRRFAAHLFFSIEKPDTFKRWVKNFNITSARTQLEDAAVFKALQLPPEKTNIVNCLYLTHAGYQAAGWGKWAPDHPAFVSGMKSRKKALPADPPVEAWEQGFQQEIHGMILLGHDDMGALQDNLLVVYEAVKSFSSSLFVQHGRMIRNGDGDGIEHFGYVDGISQPLFLQNDINEFKRSTEDNAPLWDPESDPDEILLAREPKTQKNLGSYFVFRKLEQNVAGFKKSEEKLAHILGYEGEEAETIGAYTVGRFENGTPIELSDTEHFADHLTNNFNYDDDKLGQKCPYHAHIRKVNPRNKKLKRTGGSEKNRRLIARRGIPYDDFGRRPFLDEANDVVDTAVQPTGDVGLLFMAFMSDIADQFEFIQREWSDSPDGPIQNAGLDPVIGQTLQGNNPAQQWPLTWGNPAKSPCSFHGFVSMKGGEYFFAPSIPFLQDEDIVGTV